MDGEAGSGTVEELVSAGAWLEVGAGAEASDDVGAAPLPAVADEEPESDPDEPELEPEEPEPVSPEPAKVAVPVQAAWPSGARLADSPSYSTY